MQKQLFLSNKNKMIGGVCGGLAEYFDIDPVIVRIIFVILAFSGGGFLAYIILWIIIPRASFIVTPQSENTKSDFVNQQDEENSSGVKTQKNIQPRKYFEGRLFVSILLIAIGLLWLLNNIMPNLHFIELWPVILIVLGLLLLIKSKNQ